MNGAQVRNERRTDELVIDNVLTTQPELGPSIPDGGYGWVIFFVTLFFQALIPSLVVSFGIFLAFEKLQNATAEDLEPNLWDQKLLYVPLFFIASWTFFDPTSRTLILHSTWPRLVATAGTCLTCVGLLFLWMGMTGYGTSSLFILSGIVSGIGASIQISQCEILLAQYFRLKHAVLVHIAQAVSAIGFIVAPIIIGHHILNSSLLNVILWYQAVILQGLVLNLVFKKPLYLKSKPNAYNYVTTNPDDEEDILSKNSRELQIKSQHGNGTKIETHEIPVSNDNGPQPSTSQQEATTNVENVTRKKQLWETFEDDDEEEETKYEKLKDWETFDDEEYIEAAKKNHNNKKQQSSLEEDAVAPDPKANQKDLRNHKNLRLELSFQNTEETSPRNNRPITNISGLPLPLFSDLPVNNNNTYSYDALEDQTESHQPVVFMPTTVPKKYNIGRLEVLQQPTFYKSLLTIMTTKFSTFIFFSLFPSYLYQETNYNMKLRNISNLVGLLSLSSLLFSGVSYWINIEKKRRAISLWFLCWVGAVGYYLLSDYKNEFALLFGAVQVTLSIVTLQHIGGPLLGLTVRGEATKDYSLISMMTGVLFLFFLIINCSYKECFRLMALLHLVMGTVWFVNCLYKRIRR